ncbi:7222_t:CDS:1, partial [Paraglomus occultum]
MAYYNSQNLTGGSNTPVSLPSGNPTQYSSKLTTNQAYNTQTMYAVGPDGRPNPTNPAAVYTVSDNGTPRMGGVPVMIFNNPPPMIATSTPGYCTNELFFAIFALILAIAGGAMWGASKSTFDGCLNNCPYSSYSDYYNTCAVNCRNSYYALKYSGIALLVIGGIILVGVAFVAN